MGVYVAKRVLATIPVLFVVAIVVFLILHLSPGDPAEIMAGERPSPETVDRVRRALGLDRPLLEQFLTWLWQIVRGDMGRSLYYNQPVMTLILGRIEPTLALTVSTVIFSVLLAVPLGVLSAWRAGTWIDRAVMIQSVLAFSLPVFLIGYALVLNLALG